MILHFVGTVYTFLMKQGSEWRIILHGEIQEKLKSQLMMREARIVVIIVTLRHIRSFPKSTRVKLLSKTLWEVRAQGTRLYAVTTNDKMIRLSSTTGMRPKTRCAFIEFVASCNTAIR